MELGGLVNRGFFEGGELGNSGAGWGREGVCVLGNEGGRTLNVGFLHYCIIC